MSPLDVLIPRARSVLRRARRTALVGACLIAGAAGAQESVTVRVKVFIGAQNLPIYAGIAKGIFEKHGVKVDLQFTPNSDVMRKGLAAGEFDIAHSAVDNAVHMVESAGQDTIIVMGGDSSMNEFFVQPEIKSVSDLRARVVAVDAPNTAYALLAKKILLNNGLKEGQDYTVKPVGGSAARMKAVLKDKDLAAVVLNVPFSILATRGGLKSMGRTVDLLGPYQATGAYVMRGWAQANGPTLERYIAAYVESLRWAMQPVNRAESLALLMERVKLPQDVAEQAYDLMREPKFGLATDARFDVEGFRNLFAIRAEMEGQWGGKPPAPNKYYDLQYYERAMKTLDR